jgi:WD40 repeat protein
MVASVHAVAFLGPESLLAAAWSVCAWDLGGEADQPRPSRRLEPRGYFGYAAALSPDRTTLAASYYANEDGSRFGAFRLPEDELRWQTEAMGGYESLPVAFAFSPDSETIYAGIPSGSVHAYDAATGIERGEAARVADDLKAIAVSPDGRLACAAGPNLHLLALDPPAEITRHLLGRTPFFAVSFHPSGGFFATAGGDGTVDYWDARSGAHRQAFDWGVGELYDVAFDPTGDRAACCGKTGEVVVWDVDD